MRLKRPHVASLNQVRISREEDGAVIEYVEAGFWTTHFKLGPAVHEMTDAAILDRFNEHLATIEQFRLDYKHVAIEIPPGSPHYGAQTPWLIAGNVARCVEFA